MGSFDVEVVDERVEAGLLLQDFAGWRADGLLLDGQMPALAAPVPLWLAGLDVFEGDLEPEPLDGELGEVVEAVASRRSGCNCPVRKWVPTWLTEPRRAEH